MANDFDLESSVARHVEGPQRHIEQGGEAQEWLLDYVIANSLSPYEYTYPRVLGDILQRVESGAMSVETAIAVKAVIDELWGQAEQ